MGVVLGSWGWGGLACVVSLYRRKHVETELSVLRLFVWATSLLLELGSVGGARGPAATMNPTMYIHMQIPYSRINKYYWLFFFPPIFFLPPSRRECMQDVLLDYELSPTFTTHTPVTCSLLSQKKIKCKHRKRIIVASKQTNHSKQFLATAQIIEKSMPGCITIPSWTWALASAPALAYHHGMVERP
jgi:hypothetical protein